MGKKIKGRELLEACYVRKFLFDNSRAFRAYIEELEEKCVPYEILETFWCELSSPLKRRTMTYHL